MAEYETHASGAFVCQSCGGLVEPAFQDKHTEWHIRTDHPVDDVASRAARQAAWPIPQVDAMGDTSK